MIRTGSLKLVLMPSMGLPQILLPDLTFNTDFAQVEADEEQVNLTRFSLFFPEKRPFFLEGAGLFEFGIPRTSFRRPPPLLLFYSRRIGLAGGVCCPDYYRWQDYGQNGSLRYRFVECVHRQISHRCLCY